jgi:hypothetical protein
MGVALSGFGLPECWIEKPGLPGRIAYSRAKNRSEASRSILYAPSVFLFGCGIAALGVLAAR